MEFNSESVKKADLNCLKAIQVDLNSPKWTNVLNGKKDFDVVVAADVLEHLYDPWTTLQQAAGLLGPNGYLVISLPHIGHAAIIAGLINGNFEYQEEGLLDSTHIRFFGFNDIEKLITQAKLKITEAKYPTKLLEKSEFAKQWDLLPKDTQNMLLRSKYSEVYQVVMKVVPLHYSENSIQLIPPPRKHWRHATTKREWLDRKLRFQFKEIKRSVRSLLGITQTKK